MSDWKEYKLGEIINLKRGYDLPNQNRQVGSIPIYSSSGITAYHSKAMADGPGVITGRYGTIGQVFYSKGEYWPLNTTLYVQDFKGNHPKFIFYLLKSFDFEKYSDKSAVPGVNRNDLHTEFVKIPTLKLQQSISEILSILDDKIDILLLQNKTLEQLAETLFRQWFVEEAKMSWVIDALGNVFDIGIGRTPPRKEHHWFSTNPKDVKWVSIKDMGTSGIYVDTVSEYLTQEALEQYNVPIIPENTVMLSFKMTIGRLAISSERMVSNEAIAHFKQKEKSNLFPEFLYLFFKSFKWEQLGSTSSIVEAINSQMIKDMKISIPDQNTLYRFRELIKPYFEKARINQSQIRTLTRLRDTLLPKLMSGELSVKN
jgi:type I restriction enzyme S subunit